MPAIRDFRAVLRARSLDDLKERVRREGLSPRESTRTLIAYVNHGRWVTDCLCGSGVACSPDVDQAVCMECGTVHRVKFPAATAVEAAARVLGARPVSARNWRPEDETRNDLAAENLRRGLRAEMEID